MEKKCKKCGRKSWFINLGDGCSFCKTSLLTPPMPTDKLIAELLQKFEDTFPLREIEGRINEDTWWGEAPTPLKVKSFLSQALHQVAEAEREKANTIFENRMGSTKHLQHRCPECGKETGTKMTYLESFRSNALFGSCFDCATKRPVSSS